MISLLPPLPVAGPLAIAGLLLAVSHLLPKHVPDVIAVCTALAAAAVCGLMAAHTGDQPLIYWFGGWAPQGGPTLGIAFVVDQASAVVTAAIALLFAAALVFAFGFFDDVSAHFHVLMLLFMGAMIGFCLTHDLFNMFVWFEVMSVAAFAVTGYALRVTALDGALNFTVVNTIGSYLFLGGIGLIYAQVGALDFAALGRGVAAAPDDPVITAAFALLATALLIKAAQVPFQAWLADAHGVAPSPVSVIFSGAMVAVGVFGLSKLVWLVFAGSPMVMQVVRRLLLGMGIASALIGGVQALAQRHIKRLLAFSTISHVGILLVGLALLNRDGLAGMLSYMIGHGMVKAALFMVAGILLAHCGGIDEVGLRGAGRKVWPAGVVMGFGALLLAGLPLGPMDEGLTLIEAASQEASKEWVLVPVLIGASLTGAAVLRVTGRVFAGLGESPGEEDRAPSDAEREKANRPVSLMLIPAAVLLGLGMLGLDGSFEFATRMASSLMHRQVEAPPQLHSSIWPWFSVAGAVVIAAFELGRRHLPARLVRASDATSGPPLAVLRVIHSGFVADYVAWIVVGLASFTIVFMLG